MNRRALLLAMALSAWAAARAPVLAKDGDSSGGNSGSSGSGGNGSGSDDSGGDDSGRGRSRSGRDDDGSDDEDVRREAASAVARGEIAPLSAIARIALAHTPGKIIDVKLRHEGKAYTYRIRILARNGRRRELKIDARSRAILGVK
jgi:hypothetical protein